MLLRHGLRFALILNVRVLRRISDSACSAQLPNAPTPFSLVRRFIKLRDRDHYGRRAERFVDGAWHPRTAFEHMQTVGGRLYVEESKLRLRPTVRQKKIGSAPANDLFLFFANRLLSNHVFSSVIVAAIGRPNRPAIR